MDPMEAKIAGMILLGIGTLIVGLLPAWFSANSQQWPLLLSSLLCFGGGVLLSTSLIHMLPELREITTNAELFLCFGFFLLYFIDETVHYFCSTSEKHAIEHLRSHSHCHENHQANHNHSRNYNEEPSSNRSHLRSYQEEQSTKEHSRSHSLTFVKTNGSYGSTEVAPLIGGNNIVYNRQYAYNPALNQACGHGDLESRLTQVCHVSHTEPCNDPPIGQMGLLLALSMHAILEGLAIGLENSVSKIWLLVGAVASHKLVVGFCLGVELSSGPTNTACKHFIAIMIFALGSVGGIGIGMVVTGVSHEWSDTAQPLLQGLAAGTLLYVTVCEVLPRERARWHNQTTCQSASLIQFFAVAIGFAMTTLITKYLDFDHISP